MNTGAVERGQHDQIHIERLHEKDPAGNDAKLMWAFLDSLKQQNREGTKETSDDQKQAQWPPGLRVPDQIVLAFLPECWRTNTACIG